MNATDDVDAVPAARPREVMYAASGDLRPHEALADVLRAIRGGAGVVTPALYALYDQRSAPPELREPVLAAIAEGGGSLFVSGVDPGWGNDVLPEVVAVPAERLDERFFSLGTRFAGEIMQKFANYRLRLVVVGDISRHLQASSAMRALVHESNRSDHVWFVPDVDTLDSRLKAMS